MLEVFGFMAVLGSGLYLYDAVASDDPVTLTGKVVISLIVLGIGVVALAAERAFDLVERRVEALEEANRLTRTEQQSRTTSDRSTDPAPSTDTR